MKNASTNQLVETAQTSNINQISQITPDTTVRDRMKQALDRAIAAKKSDIDNKQNATREEKMKQKLK